MHRFKTLAGLPAGLLATALLLAGCDTPPPATGVPATPREATLQVGDATVRATVAPTSSLSDTVAARYGIERGDDVVMLLVGVRQGPVMEEVSVPAVVTATATDLRGNRHDIAMRELHAGDLVDHVGTVRVDLPETLMFNVEVRRDGLAPATMQFSRDFQAR